MKLWNKKENRNISKDNKRQSKEKINSSPTIKVVRVEEKAIGRKRIRKKE